MTFAGANRAEREPLRLGRYELVYALGQGGMASVFVGIASGPAGFEKHVAVKVIHPHLLRERQFVKMFLDEAKLAAGIVHPNVAAIHEMGETDGQLYMVGELVAGQSLRALQQRLFQTHVGLTQQMIAHLGAEVCSGLHAAHELRGPDGTPLELVHRDVSPHNVLIGYDGYVKLIDFGVAQARGRLSHTETGTIKGKLGYLSPEQIAGRPLDRRSDIFSVGVVLYELATGRHPFPGDSGLERLERIRHSRYTPPREIEPGVAPELERVIMTALERRPDDRFPNAASLAETLRAFAATRPRRTGPRVLAAQMGQLFGAEIEEHRERIRAYRRRGETTARFDLEETSRLHPVPGESRSSTQEWTDSGTVLPVASPRPHRRALSKLGAGLAAAGLLIALAVAFWPGQETEPAPASDARPRAAPTSPAADAPPPRASAGATVAVDSTAMVRVAIERSPTTTRVRVDGEQLAPGIREITVPADGEPHLVECAAPGHRPQAAAIVGDRDRVISCALEPLPAEQRKRRRAARKGRRAKRLNLAENPF